MHSIEYEGLDTSPYRWTTVDPNWSPRGFHVLRVARPKSDRRYSVTMSTAYTQACFWPADKLHSPSLPGTFGSPVAVTTLDGEVRYGRRNKEAHLAASSLSGLYSVVVTEKAGDQGAEPALSLHLLQYNLDPPSVQVRQLDLPSHIDLAQIYSLAIDERVGVVYLVSDTLGLLFAVSYA
jgi:hypothetical protein